MTQILDFLVVPNNALAIMAIGMILLTLEVMIIAFRVDSLQKQSEQNTIRPLPPRPHKTHEG